MKFHPIGNTCIVDPERDFQFPFYWVVGRVTQLLENRKPRSGTPIQVCPIDSPFVDFHKIPSDWAHLYNGSWTRFRHRGILSRYNGKHGFLKTENHVQDPLYRCSQSTRHFLIFMKFNPIGNTCIVDPERDFDTAGTWVGITEYLVFWKVFFMGWTWSG